MTDDPRTDDQQPTPTPQTCGVCGEQRNSIGRYCTHCQHYDVWIFRSPWPGILLSRGALIAAIALLTTWYWEANQRKWQREQREIERNTRELEAISDVKKHFSLINSLRSPQGGPDHCPYNSYDKCIEHFESVRRDIVKSTISITMSLPLLAPDVELFGAMDLSWAQLSYADEFPRWLHHTLATCSNRRAIPPQDERCQIAEGLALRHAEIENYCMEYIQCIVLRREGKIHHFRTKIEEGSNTSATGDSPFCKIVIDDREEICLGNDMRKIPGYSDFFEERGAFISQTECDLGLFGPCYPNFIERFP